MPELRMNEKALQELHSVADWFRTAKVQKRDENSLICVDEHRFVEMATSNSFLFERSDQDRWILVGTLDMIHIKTLKEQQHGLTRFLPT